MKKILGLRTVIDLTLAILLIGGLVYAFGFGICLYLAREEVTEEVDKRVERDMDYIQSYIDGQLQRVEDVAYTFLGTKFGASKRDANGKGYVVIDQNAFEIPTEDECFRLIEELLETNPHICGVAIGFERFLYTSTKGQYGFSAYVTNVSGKNERLSLGEMHDFHEKEWYREAAKTNSAYWSRPFRETSHDEVVTCYSVPLHGIGGRLIGVLALDINTSSFREKCKEVAPCPGSEVTLADREFRFVSHPDSTYLLRSIAEVGEYVNYKADDSMRIKMQNHESGRYTVNAGTQQEALFYFCPVPRTGWTVSVECPKREVYGGVQRMKRDTTFIAIVSLLAMILSFIFIFRRLQSMTLTKAGLEGELRVASGVQMSMIPKLYPAFPTVPQLDVCGYLKSAKSVGGDLYDYLIRDGRLYFCIGDVSGKGVPASLFMMVVLALFRSTSQHSSDPAQIMKDLNDTINRGNTQCMFCTMFIGVLDLATGKLDYCNGGHNPPILRRVDDEGKVHVDYMAPKSNIAVGMMEGFDYVGESITLRPTEAIFLYTDGVTEAENHTHDLFGEEATLAALADARAHNVRSARDFISHVATAVEHHAGGADQSDDITMLVVEYKGMKE